MARPSKMGGKTSESKARNAKPAKGRKTTKTKRRIAPAAVRVKRRSVSGPNNDLKEARAQQASTAEILKVIASSPSDVQPVFEAIAASANRLLGGFSTAVSRFIDGMVHLAAFTPVNPKADAALRSTFPAPTAVLPAFVLAARGEPAQIADTEALADERLLEISRARGYRSVLFVPLMSGELPIGMISVARVAPGTFARHHVQLLQTFADQAVIAIENTRLFNETQQALERQTATAEVLKVIARSPSDTTPVFEAIVSSAAKLFEPCSATITTRRGEKLYWDATASSISGYNNERASAIYPIPFDPERSSSARAMLDRRTIQIPDVAAPDTPDLVRKAAAAGGFRSITFVPLVDRQQGIGTIIFTHPQAGFTFSAQQLTLFQTFADQAVIAIQNARQFNETQEALERQTATADILKVIASSPSDVQPVFQAIADRSKQLVNGLTTAVVSIVDDVVHLAAFTPTTPEADAGLQAFYPRPLSAFTYADAISRGAIHQIVDAETELAAQPDILRLTRQRGWRSAVWVPLLREGKAIGMIRVTRREPGTFTDHHVAMLKTFADQAVIAISNVNLFKEVQQRTRELSQSLDDLRAAQDRLIQTEKLASLGQLTAGIAHEIKNPLNFVNNFSGMSSELIGELQDIVGGLSIDPETHADIKELTDMLSANLGKIVQHGKRADGIVKSMLLHSGQSSGEHRLSDMNALVDESLSRAYYGERAETRGFTIKLEKSFDPTIGEVDLFPREISRAVLNLISNSFYATSKRREADGSDYEPVLVAATRNLGDRVEIRIRDNGSGIPPDVKGKMFEPFFTTKPAGEGTGLGLSITHDIVVKQHGGWIEVDTKLGEFTEVRLILPRTGALLPERQ
jgi:two-component system NtrC family sensor kinase